MLTVGDVVAALDRRYPAAWAEPWDAVGLQVGDPARPAARVLFAVDVTEAVMQEALSWQADLIVAHHPLLFRPLAEVTTRSPKGRIVSTLLANGCAVYAAHTNADVARPGVNDALAAALGVIRTRPLVPADAAGAPGVPGEDARGHGRVGVLAAPVTLREVAERVAAALPATAHGVRVAGDLDRVIGHVALCGGAGDDFLEAAAGADVDVYVTSDLRHHVSQEALEAGGPALIDVAHWASEWPWLQQAARLLIADLPGDVAGQPDEATPADTVQVRVSTLVTDPWTIHLSATEEAGGTP